jgi:chorismate mutase-like protein
MDLSEWRDRIDEVDRKLLELLNERARCVLGLAPLKKKMAIPIYEPQREEAVFRNIAQHNGGPLSPDAVRRIFERIIDEMRSIQRPVMEDEEPKP